jgi:hypothetical protein
MAAPASDHPPPSRAWHPLKIAGATGAAVGVAAASTSLILILLAKGKDNEAAKLCDGDRCPDAHALGIADDAKTLANAATVVFAAGAVLIAGGVALMLFSPKRTTASSVSRFLTTRTTP